MVANKRTGFASHTEPILISGTGILESIPWPWSLPVNHTAIGSASILGDYFADGWMRTVGRCTPDTAEFTSPIPVIFIAADGDQLLLDCSGSIRLSEVGGEMQYVAWTAAFSPVIGASTGRFAHVVAGRLSLNATTETFAPSSSDVGIGFSWFGEGSLVFGRSPSPRLWNRESMVGVSIAPVSCFLS